MLEGILLILAVIAVSFARTLKFGHVVDDINHAKFIAEGGLSFKYPYSIATRFRYLCYGVLFPNKPWLDHLITTCIHAAICVLAFVAFGATQASLVGALWYAVHPINHQTSVWLNGRRYQMNILFCLLALWLIPKFPLAAGLYFLTPILQINALFFPVIFFQTHWPVLMFMFPICIGLALPGIKTWLLEKKSAKDCEETWAIKPDKLIIVVKTMGFYGRRMLLPGVCTMWYTFLQKFGMEKKATEKAYEEDFDFFIGVFFLGCMGSLLVFWPNKGFTLLVLLSLAQWGNLITPTQIIADRYVSFANLFFMQLLSMVVSNSIPEPWGLMVAAILFGMYWAWLWPTMEQYRDLNSFFDWNIAVNPGYAHQFGFKAESLQSNGNPVGALHVAMEGLRLSPNDCGLNFKAAIFAFQLGLWEEGDRLLLRGVENVYTGQEIKWISLARKIKELYPTHQSSSSPQVEKIACSSSATGQTPQETSS